MYGMHVLFVYVCMYVSIVCLYVWCVCYVGYACMYVGHLMRVMYARYVCSVRKVCYISILFTLCMRVVRVSVCVYGVSGMYVCA